MGSSGAGIQEMQHIVRECLRAPGPVAYTGIVIALGSECCAVSPSDPRFNPDFVDEALAELLSLEEKCPVSVHQISSSIDRDLLIVTVVDAAGPGAVSSKTLSQTLMMQALNPESLLRRRGLGIPLRNVPPPGSVVRSKQETKLNERDIPAIAVSKLVCKLVLDQQHLVDQMSYELKRLERVLDLNFEPERRKIFIHPHRNTFPRKHGVSLYEDEKDEAQIESRLEELRKLTIRQTNERNAMISNLEDVLVHIFVVRSMQRLIVLSSVG